MSESSRRGAFVYDNLAKLGENKEVIHGWLRERGILGDFSGQSQCGNCGQGELHSRPTFTAGVWVMVAFGDVLGKLVVSRCRFEKDLDSLNRSYRWM